MTLTEKRVRDVELGEHVRLIGDLEEEYGEVINIGGNGDDVLLTVTYPPEVTNWPVDLPALDGDAVVEVLT